MPETPGTDHDQNKEAEKPSGLLRDHPLVQVEPVGLPVGLRWILGCGVVVLLGLLAASIFVPNLSERVKFFTVNALSVLVFFVILVQAYIYRKQWDIMERQYKISRGQAITLHQQSLAMHEQADAMTDTLIETRKMVELNQLAFEINQKQSAKQMSNMEGQLAAMRQLASAGELQAKAAEMSAKVHQQSIEVMTVSYIATTRAYIGIREITVGALVVGKIPTVSVVWYNGGKTPASRLRANVYLVVGDKPEWRSYQLEDDWSDSKANFLPPGVSNPVLYPQVETGFKPLTQEMLDAITLGGKRLYAMVEAEFLDFMDEPRPFETSYIFDPWQGTFTEL